MMRNIRILFVLLLSACLMSAEAQTKRHKIALFTPLYLDSTFDASGNYRFDKTFPKFLNAGLEFYEGAQLALDSLNKVGAPVEVFVYDSRSKKQSISQQLNSPELADVEMIIAHATGAEARIFADAALKKKIPFISATYPNDAGITNNPYYVILNSTLRTHCEGLYRYLQGKHALDRIVFFTRNGAQEDQVKEYFTEFAKTTSSVPLKIDFRNIGNNFSAQTLKYALDSNRKTICVAGSLDEGFGLKLAQQLSSLKSTYPLAVVGMPTWDNFNLAKPEFKNTEIIYSTPFYYGRPTSLLNNVSATFQDTMHGKPTDMFFRGYETMLRFGLLLLDAKTDVSSNLTRKGNYIFTPMDIQPVFLNKQTMTLDYFENKKLHFIRVYNGVKTIQ
jgi:ABC-type branched-subunit amino acid transport system substrate-binding protein